MGFGDTAKKIQALADRAEQLYAQLKDVRERVIALEAGIDETNDRITELENDSEKQLVLLKAIAREQGINVEEVLAEAAIEEAESAEETADADETEADEPTDDAEPADPPEESSDGAEPTATND